MKHVKKGSEPTFFTDWKQGESEDWNPGWGDFDSSRTAKKRFKEHLMDEQGAICCYCNGRTELVDSHIEHFRPRSKYPDLVLDYDNLLLSCQRDGARGTPQHCGMRKDKWFDESLTVSPLDPACESAFEYRAKGGVRGATAAGKKTVCRLGLDIKKLRILREAAITAALEEIDVNDTTQVEEQVTTYSRRNPVTGQFTPFCSAVVAVLASLC